MDAALASIYSAGFAEKTLAGTVPTTGALATLKWTMEPMADETLDGVSRKVIRKTLTTTVTTSGSSPASDTQTYKAYFSVSPNFNIWGSAPVVANGSITITSARGNLPTAGVVGASGDFYSSVSYSDLARTVLTATSEVTWSLIADGISSSTAYACLNEKTTDRRSGSTFGSISESSECYRIDQSGTLLGVLSRVTLTDASGNKVVIDLK